ncbi:MAG: monofunctional biosynthetic peptidoglycan transglycosylase [Bacteroidetes bacterium]|nr:monofunctional biosynthetic peptidoglycan transglycosylase [Bacteroidota bacterium]MBK9672197.1 monofunctional biosynthetic peptidoglycan transglycosylase [Bacteroidota bacterium]MBP6412329.1 monofunctional biosynthetic peptidoglycan transglycosylase [Bacteroidia bacterium]
MKEVFKKVVSFCWKALLIFFAVSILSVLLFRWIPIPFTPLMGIRLIEQLVEGKSLKCSKDWEPIENISPNLPLAVVCSEDQLFMEHHGFDLKAIEKAMAYNKKKKGKKIRGASTISQQTAKNVFLWQGRSWVRKGLEVYFTGLIEFMWSKERIMEVYLNVIEMGDGVYGSQAAAKANFKKDAKKLSQSEAALIAATLPNPRKWSASAPSKYVQKRKNWILRQMNYHGGAIELEPEEEEEN